MAAVTSLHMEFTNADGTGKSMTFNYINPEVDTNAVKALMNGIVTMGSIFDDVPTGIKSAELITKETTKLEVTD